jgi:hypothetical protein
MNLNMNCPSDLLIFLWHHLHEIADLATIFTAFIAALFFLRSKKDLWKDTITVENWLRVEKIKADDFNKQIEQRPPYQRTGYQQGAFSALEITRETRVRVEHVNEICATSKLIKPLLRNGKQEIIYYYDDK